MSAPPAGWYPDPQNPYLQRWWNGSAWTEVSSVGQSSPPARGGVQTAEPEHVAKKNSAAMWGFVLSLVSIPVWALGSWVSILAAAGAIALGVVGIARAKSAGKGFGLALAAVIIGGVQGLGGIAILLAFG